MNELIPSEFFLSQNYPNPFKDKTVIKYCIGYTTRVKLTIQNSDGGVIVKLVDEVKQPGTYEIKLSTFSENASKILRLPDGYYLYRLDAGEYFSEKKWLCKNSI